MVTQKKGVWVLLEYLGGEEVLIMPLGATEKAARRILQPSFNNSEIDLLFDGGNGADTVMVGGGLSFKVVFLSRGDAERYFGKEYTATKSK